MAKRKRDNGDIGDKVSDEETSHSSEEKRLKVPSTVDEVQVNRYRLLFGMLLTVLLLSSIV